MFVCIGALILSVVCFALSLDKRPVVKAIGYFGTALSSLVLLYYLSKEEQGGLVYYAWFLIIVNLGAAANNFIKSRPVSKVSPPAKEDGK